MKVYFLNDASSAQQLANDIPIHIREPIIPAIEFVRQFFVVEPQQVQDSGMQVMYADFVCDGFVAKFVGFAISGRRV